MKLQEDPAALEVLAKQLLKYFIDAATGHLAIQRSINTLQSLSDNLSNYYLITTPYQIISGNAKVIEGVDKFKDSIKTLVEKKDWDVYLAFAVIQAINKFLIKNDWSLNAVNNNFIVELCCNMQQDLQLPCNSKQELQDFLHDKNGRVFVAELENALGKAITQHSQKLAVIREEVGEREKTVSDHELSGDDKTLSDAESDVEKNPKTLVFSRPKPLFAFGNFFSFSSRRAKPAKSPVDEMEEVEEEQEYSDEENRDSYLGLLSE